MGCWLHPFPHYEQKSTGSPHALDQLYLGDIEANSCSNKFRVMFTITWVSLVELRRAGVNDLEMKQLWCVYQGACQCQTSIWGGMASSSFMMAQYRQGP